MSTLARFRKTGGPLQLIQLVETSDPDKQKHLLELIALEDPGWAHLIKLKRLTMAKILRWPSEVLARILLRLPPVLCATLAVTVSAEERVKLEYCLSGSTAQDVRQALQVLDSREVSPQEKWAAQVKVIQVARELILKGELRLSTFDPTLEIDGRLVS